MRRRVEPPALLAAVVAAALAGCGGKPALRDDEPTLKSLAGRTIEVDRERGIDSSEARAIAAYRNFLDAAPAKAPQRVNDDRTPRRADADDRAPRRAEAMRRLGDLEMDVADSAGASGASPPDYRAAVQRYRRLLGEYPNHPGNDRVLYQLARAHETGGELEIALQTLDRLVREHPGSAVLGEAQFRRGELLFSMREYPKAEAAYASVLAGDDDAYRDRALYMQGWSRFKQGRLDEALASFFGVLDAALADAGDEPLDESPGLSRADRELVEDTLRVVGISLANLDGAQSIAPLVGDSEARRAYEFRVYRQLGELYIRQERSKDAADTFAAFAKARPLHAQAPQLQARVIEIYERNGFANLALDAKREYVVHYGSSSDFRRANEAGWQRAQPLVKAHLGELARHHHALAQKQKSRADAEQAIRWYRELIGSFADDAATPAQNFLLAELLHDEQRHAEAATEYERTAYAYPRHPKSADAGYAALLAHGQHAKRASAADAGALRLVQVESAQRFAAAFAGDARVAPVLTDAAEKLYAMKQGGEAAKLAQQVLAIDGAKPSERKVASTVIAHAAFDSGDWLRAERAYADVIALSGDRERGELVEKQAAAIYKQGEAARDGGDARAAVAHFERVPTAAAARANAEVDAAAALIGLKDWDAAARSLEDFRRRFGATHALQADVDRKLAAVYLEQGKWSKAADELDRIATASAEAQVARDALWQAAELHEKADAKSAAAKVYERVLRLPGLPFDRGVEARWRLARIANGAGDRMREASLMRELQQADAAAGSARTPRSQELGARASLSLAEPIAAEYRKVALVEPLAKSLKAKKARFEDALKAYAVAADYGVAEVTTAATCESAALYQDFGKSLLGSERPKKLKSKAEREQYDVLLEEQAFPFEEKATALHETNARRAADGIWDDGVRRSYAALRELRPLRYGKTEVAVEGGAASAGAQVAQGVALRREGRFADARDAYDRALAIDPAHAPALLNLAILQDLYLWQRDAALATYERYLATRPDGDATVAKWVADLRAQKKQVASATTERKP